MSLRLVGETAEVSQVPPGLGVGGGWGRKNYLHRAEIKGTFLYDGCISRRSQMGLCRIGIYSFWLGRDVNMISRWTRSVLTRVRQPDDVVYIMSCDAIYLTFDWFSQP